MADFSIPSVVKTWTIGGGSGNIRSSNSYSDNSGYTMYSSPNKEYLTYKHQDWGINLGFVGDSNRRTGHFRTPDNAERDILSGEPVAFAVGGEEKQFLFYAHRDYGINLNWSKDPVFQWRLFREDDQLGVPIQLGSVVAIMNEKGDDPDPDFFIYHKRTVGGQIGWPSTPGFWDNVWNVAKGKAGKYARDAAKAYFAS